MIMKVVLFLFLILQGSTYTFDVADTGYAVITHDIVITASEPMDSYVYYVPFPINDLDVYSDKAVRGEFTNLGMQAQITLYLSLETDETALCICEYVSWDIISKEGSQWWLYLPPMESVTVIMPRGANISYLVTESDFPSISEEEERIHLFWEYIPEDVYVYYELGIVESNTWWWVIPLVGVIGVVAAAVYVLGRRKNRRTLSSAVLSVLNKRERNIVEYLHAQGRCRQAKISRGLTIPKTSLSKILIRMEERGIIKRERDGNLTYCELDERAYQ